MWHRPLFRFFSREIFQRLRPKYTPFPRKWEYVCGPIMHWSGGGGGVYIHMCMYINFLSSISPQFVIFALDIYVWRLFKSMESVHLGRGIVHTHFLPVCPKAPNHHALFFSSRAGNCIFFYYDIDEIQQVNAPQNILTIKQKVSAELYHSFVLICPNSAQSFPEYSPISYAYA